MLCEMKSLVQDSNTVHCVHFVQRHTLHHKQLGYIYIYIYIGRWGAKNKEADEVIVRKIKMLSTENKKNEVKWMSGATSEIKPIRKKGNDDEIIKKKKLAMGNAKRFLETGNWSKRRCRVVEEGWKDAFINNGVLGVGNGKRRGTVCTVRLGVWVSGCHGCLVASGH